MYLKSINYFDDFRKILSIWQTPTDGLNAGDDGSELP